MQLWGPASLNAAGQASRLETRGELMSQLKPEGSPEAELLLPREPSVFFSLETFI